MADDPFDSSDLAAAVTTAIDGGNPATIEVDGGGATVRFRAIPLRPRGETSWVRCCSCRTSPSCGAATVRS